MPRAIGAMADLGVDISGHRSVPVDAVDILAYSLVLVMERGHREALLMEFPELAGRIYLVSEMTGSANDIGDPVSGPAEDYRYTAETLADTIDRGFERIQLLARDISYSPQA